MQVISYEVNPIGWLILAIIIVGIVYMIFKRKREKK